MNYLRLVFLGLLGFLAYWQVAGQIGSAFSTNTVIKADGLLNIWASYSGLLICTYLSIYYLKDILNLSINIGNVNKVGILMFVVIAPLLAIATFGQTKSNVSGYVECKHERKVSSRYSSRTYAINDEICASLKDNK
ncbi:hypothetical protein [Vibrio furnissii]|uniref:hypothetical protein n=1 Tax=Vibrio furnissii TaxID=29494 RepID=UPI00056E93A7|nr:hypothetical protein [Vibrio furnissii]QDC92985.1 hypothetical protein FIU11_09800 [Vibrio furnissii]UON48388.1 hypothetical protein IUJ52_01215 [Vibrio furnissii]SUP45382.1 Uncharacterised protein [Vibrio furnissii]